MNNDGVIPSVAKLLETKTVFSIVLPANPTFDAVAGAISLYLALVKIGKSVSIACGTPVDGAITIPGVDKIQKELVASGDNLVISFPYEDGAIDKITYNIEGDSFNLVIAPKEGRPRLETSNVKYNYKGGKGEVIFVIDAPSLASLGDMYTNQKDTFTGVEIINIDRHLTNGNYGSINFVEKQRSSTSELIFMLLTSLSLEVDKDMATNLYAGIITATNNFTSYSVNADTFEVSAKLLKLGAVKKIPSTPLRATGQQLNNVPVEQSSNEPMTQSETITVAPEQVENKEVNADEATSKEWLKPKIFKGGGLV